MVFKPASVPGKLLPNTNKSYPSQRRKAGQLLWGVGLVGLLALLGWFGLWSAPTLPSHDPKHDQMFMVANVFIITPDGQPATGAVATLDDNQQVMSDGRGLASFEHIMHADHNLNIYYNGQHYRQPIHIHSADTGLILGLSEEWRIYGIILLGFIVALWLAFGLKSVIPRFRRSVLAGIALRPGLRPVSGLALSFTLLILLVPLFAGGEGLAQAAPAYDPNLPVPDNLQVQEDDNNAILSWDGGEAAEPAKPQGVGGYRISWGFTGQPLDNVTLTEHRVIQLQPLLNGKSYAAQVQAVDMQGNLSTPSKTVSFTGTTARVDALRSRMTGFFDDFNRPAGAVDELKWNSAYSYCTNPAYSAMFINNQFHAHNMVSATSCDRGQSISRPRATFDFTGRTGTISFDFDGEFRRDQWYLDLIPQRLDITGQVSIEAMDIARFPANMLRFHQNEQVVEILYIDANGYEKSIARTDWKSYKTLDWAGVGLVPNVRRHWELKISQKSAEVLINGVSVLRTDELNLPFSKATVLWNEFSYNTSKSNEPFVLVHWDNFGWDGPPSQSETHNYRTAGYGGADYAEPQNESVKREIKIPDQINGATAQRLMFTLQMRDHWYEWSSDDKATVNGKAFAIPKPFGVNIEPVDLVSAINPYSMTIDLPPGLLKTGNNEIEFSCKSCGLNNVHIELDFPAGAAPAYTPPEKIYPLVTIPVMPDVGPGVYIRTINRKTVELSGTVDEAPAKEVYPVSGVVPVVFVAHNDIAMNATGKNPGLSKVEVRLNQQPIYTLELKDAPYSEFTYDLDTTRYANGRYSLDIVAYNQYGTPSTPDYFQSDTSEGDYYPLQLNITNPQSGQLAMPPAPSPGKRTGLTATQAAGIVVQPTPVVTVINPATNAVSASTAAPAVAVAASNPPKPAASANDNSEKSPFSRANLKALLPLLLGGLLAFFSLYLATGALVGDRLRRNRQAKALSLGLILGWPYFTLRRKPKPKKDGS